MSGKVEFMNRSWESPSVTFVLQIVFHVKWWDILHPLAWFCVLSKVEHWCLPYSFKVRPFSSLGSDPTWRPLQGACNKLCRQDHDGQARIVVSLNLPFVFRESGSGNPRFDVNILWSKMFSKHFEYFTIEIKYILKIILNIARSTENPLTFLHGAVRHSAHCTT